LLFKTKSKSALSETVLDPEFITDLEVQQANKSIDEYISSQLTTMTSRYAPLVLFAQLGAMPTKY